jgi:hypothetical protein
MWRVDFCLICSALSLAPGLLALFGEFFSSLFGMNENVIRVRQFFVPCFPDLAEPAPVIKLDLVLGLQEFLVDSACSSWAKPCNAGKFGLENSGSLQHLTVSHDCRE